MELENRVVLVTGARRGIGQAIAAQAAAAGAWVVVHARERGQAEASAREIAAAQRIDGPRAPAAVWGDLQTLAGIRGVAEAVRGLHGRLDGLVNNAGGAIVGPSADYAEADWDSVFGVNVKAVFFLSQAVLPLLRASPAGRIVNISSIHAETAIPGRAVYASAKAAVSHLTRVLAVEWAPYRITVNGIAPGFVRTERIAGLLEREEPALVSWTPLGRIGDPADIAAAARYLLSDAARHVTGEVIRIDGGWNLYGGWRPPEQPNA